MYRNLYSKLVYPLYHGLIGSGAVKAGRELNSHDKFTREQLRALEKNKLADLLTYARNNVPYYRDIIGQSGQNSNELADIQHFRSLPLLSKTIIRQQGARLQTENADGNKLDPNSTSGSTGSPMYFLTDRRSKSYRKAAVIRNRSWLGIRTGDPVVHIWGSAIDEAKAEAFRGRVHARITREAFLSAYQISDADFARYARIIERNGARLLIGYPSVLSDFSMFCGSRALRFPQLHAIISSAEALYDHHRKTIEDNFNVQLFNRYGCREVGDIAHEVPGQAGLVVNSDRILVEIIDSRGEPCLPGDPGRIIVTDLDNYGMPLIRYDIGDIGCWAPSGKYNGRLPYPVLQSVEGRSLDIITSPSGARVGGTFWTILFRERPGIDKFQVVQEQADGVVVRFVQNAAVGSIDCAFFSAKIKAVFGPGFSVQFSAVDRIEPEPNGKYRIVVSRLGQNPQEPASSGIVLD